MVPALPVLPTTACPTVAAALGAASLGPACQLAGAAGGVAGSVAGSAVSGLAGAGINGVLDGLGSWVAAGASWLLGQIGAVINATTTIDLGAQWFGSHYETMAALAGAVVIPLLLLGVMQAVYRQSVSMLLRTAFVHLPLSILLTAVAVKLVQLGLALTDAMSAGVASGAGLDSGHFMGTVTDALAGTPAAGSPGTPAFVLFLGALAVVVGAVLVWIELLLRAAAVYVAVLFLPLALASLVWPAISHWSRRLVDTLVALVLGKFVIVSVLSLAVGALAGGTGSVPAGSRAALGPGGSGGSGGSGGFSAVLGGAAILLLAAFAPWALFRLLPFVEAGAVAQLENVSHRARHTAVGVPARKLAHDAMKVAGVGRFAAGAGTGGLATAAAVGAAAAGGAASAAGAGGRGAADSAAGRPPDPGPSSAQAIGVGSTEPPASSIEVMPPHERASRFADYVYEGRPGNPEGIELPELHYPAEDVCAPDDRAPLQPSPGRHMSARGLDAPVLLPRATGTDKQHWLGSDALGPRLIAGPDPNRRHSPPMQDDD